MFTGNLKNFISIYVVSFHIIWILIVGFVLIYRWILSKAKKDDTDDEIAKYDGESPFDLDRADWGLTYFPSVSEG